MKNCRTCKSFVKKPVGCDAVPGGIPALMKVKNEGLIGKCNEYREALNAKANTSI